MAALLNVGCGRSSNPAKTRSTSVGAIVQKPKSKIEPRLSVLSLGDHLAPALQDLA